MGAARPCVPRPGDPLSRTNVLNELRFGWGDVDAASADIVVENVYTFPMITHFAIEPHAFIAAPELRSAPAAAGGAARFVIALAIIPAVFALGWWVFTREAPRVAENL